MAGLIEGAIGGLAAAGGSMAQGYIDDERRVDVQKQLSAMEEARQLRIQEAQERIRQSGAKFDTQQKIDSAAPLARAQAGAATDPEVLAAERAKMRNTAVGGAEAETDPTVLGAAREKVRNEALAGEQQDVVDAEVAKNSRAPVTLSPGQERVVPQGKDKPDLVRKSSSPTVADLYKDGVRTDGGGRSGGAAASNFDAKQWDSAFKPAPELVSWMDPDTGKGQRSAGLTSLYRATFNELRAQGNQTPAEVSEATAAVMATVQLKVEKLVSQAMSSGKTLSREQALDILVRKARSQGAPPPAPAPKTGGAPAPQPKASGAQGGW